MAMGTFEVWREILEDIIEDLCFYFRLKDVTNTFVWTEKVMYMSKRIKERGNDEEKESA